MFDESLSSFTILSRSIQEFDGSVGWGCIESLSLNHPIFLFLAVATSILMLMRRFIEASLLIIVNDLIECRHVLIHVLMTFE